MNALECAHGPDLFAVTPAGHPGHQIGWMWRALRWFEVLSVVGLVSMFIHSILTGPGNAAPPR